MLHYKWLKYVRFLVFLNIFEKRCYNSVDVWWQWSVVRNSEVNPDYLYWMIYFMNAFGLIRGDLCIILIVIVTPICHFLYILL